MAVNPTKIRQLKFRLNGFIKNQLFLAGMVLLFQASIFAASEKKQLIEAENGALIGGASIVADKSATGGQLVNLTRPGQCLNFKNLPEAGKLAIRYASENAGTISVVVNHQPAVKVNIHSSGAWTGSFLIAIINISIPKGAELDIRLENSDVALNIDHIIVGNGDLGLPPDIWNLPRLQVTDGPYRADWKDISRLYTVPAWWREAKFGAWAHWDPQSMPEQGDWYARGMYMEGHWQYNSHLSHFGHPAEYGYKDICHNWVIDKWNPEELMNLYVEMGARYFMAMGVHHDNFDCWNSAYQPWNSVNVGPKVDIVGNWEKIARQHGMRFGIGFHNSPPRTWGQFMPVRYTCDKEGPRRGIPYDALQTIHDGKGKWWDGMDPVDLYGPVHDINNPLQSPFANQFMWRVDDAVTKYHPDVIYFDEAAGDSLMDLGVHMGLGFLAPALVANYYNKSLTWNHGKMDVVINLKCVGGLYNSFKKNPGLIPFVERALVKSSEFVVEPEIMAYPFQTETSISDWHYKTGQEYMSAQKVVELLMENVSRNGAMLLNITQHGRGDLDPEVIRICKDVGAWLKVNGEAVYGSRPFELSSENSVRFTRNNGYVYATVLDWKDSVIVMKALRSGGNTLGKVSKVELLGSNMAINFEQDENGLIIIPSGTAQPLPGIVSQSLSEKYRVLRLTHDKSWFNDDDPGVVAPGWFRSCNLGTGDFNNDLTISETPGDIWSCSFTGMSIAVVAPKEPGAGKIEIQIDERKQGIIDLSTSGGRKPRQVVYTETGLIPGKHNIKIINLGFSKVAIDALIIK
jgi:alpha-L-fucosidase